MLEFPTNIATAAGCLAGVELAGWVVEEKAGKNVRDTVTQSVMPVGTSPLNVMRPVFA